MSGFRSAPARIHYLDQESVFALNFPHYDKWAVEVIRHEIPRDDRWYDTETRTWFIGLGWEQSIVVAMRMAFGDVVFENEAGRRNTAPNAPAPTMIRQTDAAYRELCLQPNAPAELIEAAYEVLRNLRRDTAPIDAAFASLQEAGAA